MTAYHLVWRRKRTSPRSSRGTPSESRTRPVNVRTCNPATDFGGPSLTRGHSLPRSFVREASGTATDLDPVDVELGAVEAVREVREDHYFPFCAKGLAASLSTTNPAVVLLRNPTYVRT